MIWLAIFCALGVWVSCGLFFASARGMAVLAAWIFAAGFVVSAVSCYNFPEREQSHWVVYRATPVGGTSAGYETLHIRAPKIDTIEELREVRANIAARYKMKNVLIQNIIYLEDK